MLAAQVGAGCGREAAVAEAATVLGGLDALVASVGVFDIGTLAETTEDDWDRTIGVNLMGAFTAIRAAAPLLRASRRGRIVANDSDCGRHGIPRQAPYTASKFGLVDLTEAVAAELGTRRVAYFRDSQGLTLDLAKTSPVP